MGDDGELVVVNEMTPSGTVVPTSMPGYNHERDRRSSSGRLSTVEFARSFNQFGGGVVDGRYSTVENSSSSTMWNCGLTRPVRKFKTSATEPA